jgi:hypothetical protein
MKNTSRTGLRETTVRAAANPIVSFKEKKLLTTVPVRKPARHEFIRVHADPRYRLSPAAITEGCLLPSAYGDTHYALFLAINRQGVPLIWPVPLPGPYDKYNAWHRKAAEAAGLAMTRWVRLEPNPSLGTYDIFEVVGDMPEPSWPDLPFIEILKIAFRDKIVGQIIAFSGGGGYRIIP